MVEKAAPVENVNAADLAGSLSHDMSFFSLFMQADIVVKLVMVLLIMASIWCWAIIFEKLMLYRRMRREMQKFEETFWSGTMLDQLYTRTKGIADHPIAAVFVAGMSEWNNREDSSSNGDHAIKISFKERIYQAMNVARNRALERLENRLSFLATVGSTAPFIGLFGTVWGIMNSFQSIAMTKNTTLAVVAPGIAEALFATAIGLFAAIPAVIFYNKLTNDLNGFVNKTDDFSIEFGAILSRELDGAR